MYLFKLSLQIILSYITLNLNNLKEFLYATKMKIIENQFKFLDSNAKKMDLTANVLIKMKC